MIPFRTNANTQRPIRSLCPVVSGLPRSFRAATLGTLVILASACAASVSPAVAGSTDKNAPVRTHRVVWGETTTRIAARYHVAVWRLLWVNGMKHGRDLKAGTVLRIPSAPAERPQAASPRTAAPAAPAAKTPEAPLPASPKPAGGSQVASQPAPRVSVAEATPRPVSVERQPEAPAPVVVAKAAATRVDTVRRVGEPILVTPSRSRLLAVQKATRVQIDDAAGTVAEVQPLSTHELLILAKAPGTTTLRVWDERGIVEHEVQVVSPSSDLGGQVTRAIGVPQVSARMIQDSIILEGQVPAAADAARAERIATAFAPKVVNLVRISAEPAPIAPAAPGVAEQVRAALKTPGIEVEGVPGRNDAVILSGTAGRDEDIERAVRAAGAFAQTVVNLVELARPDQVRVQVRMVDVDRRALRELGIKWPDEASYGQEQPGGEFRMLTNLTATIKALQEEKRANTLATPSLLVASGEKGEITIGGKLPIPALITGYAGSAGGSVAAPAGTNSSVGSGLLGQSVQFMDFGVKLEVAPKVLAGGEIALKLGTEVSAIDRTTAVTINGSVVPGFTSKRTDTTFRVQDGETLVIGGLISKEEARAVQKFPILAEVPILGRFFQSVRKDTSERELIMFVTPQLVAKGEPSAAALDRAAAVTAAK